MAAPDLTDTSIADLLDLGGRTAVVTGGASGIGRAITTRLAEAGATVFVGDLDGDAAAAAADAVPGDVHGLAMDATSPSDNDAVADRAVGDTGRLDVWVNNAGIYPFVGVTDMTDDDWARVVDLNLTGTFLGARAAATRMIDAGNGGVIINLASTAGYGAEGPGIAHYVATKHGVRGFTKSLAVELGPHGIRSVALAPTYIRTPGTDAGREEIAEMTGADPVEAFAERSPLGRAGVPDDVARVALFAASGLAAFVSGDTLLVDSGVRAI